MGQMPLAERGRAVPVLRQILGHGVHSPGTIAMLWFFLWGLWLFLLFRVLMDIFRSQDLGGWGKAGWVIFAVILPFLGMLMYLIARGRTMTERDIA